MPRRGKREAGRAPSGRAPPHLRSSRDRDRATPSPANAGLAAFTLQDEARSTAHRSSPWSVGSRLRHRPVAFVSTGSIEPLKQLEEDILQHEPNNQSTDEPNVVDPQLDAVPQDEPASIVDKAPLLGTTSESDARDVAISAAEDETFSGLRTDEEDNQNDAEPEPEPQLTEEASAPLPFFLDVTGDRNSQSKAPVRIQPRSHSPAASNSSEEVILFTGRNKTSQSARAPMDNNKSFSLHGLRTEINVVEESVKPQSDRITFLRSVRHNSRRQSVREQKRQEDDELIADYIANMREHGDDEGLVPTDAYSKRDIGGSLSESESIEVSFNTITASGDPEHMSDDESEPGDVPDETNEATQGSNLEHTPTKHANKGKNRAETARGDDALLAVIETDVSYPGSLEQSLAEDVSLLSETSEKEDDEDHLFNTVADRFANEIDDFDLMDWERPALKRKKGAKNRIPIFNISDSELEEKMQTAWSKDRMKKAEKKRERQALRAQGLLGKHANPEDLRIKYPNGMGLDQIADELRTFLVGNNAILTLPPMNNQVRKVIHELASKFNIKSKSTGSGDQRRPMLRRTFRTAEFAEETFDAAIARVGRKYFPRNDTALRAAVQRQSARRGGGGGHAGIKYRDGEVVGGSAPELGQENKGRAMLEKMGWSSGTALGALNNKGILQPVVHVVKRSKAGLG